MPESIIFEKSRKGRKGYTIDPLDVHMRPIESLIPDNFIREQPARLPEIGENEVVRHFIRLSHMNYHIDKGLYPLGSCTMKYNPKINEDTASLSGFAKIHPRQPVSTVQGCLQVLWEIERILCEITGLKAVTTQPAAGSHGELTGIMLMRKYHEKNNSERKTILIPDSAHGTNPSSVTIGGYSTVELKSCAQGIMDLHDLQSKLTDDVAGLMVTNPNTLGFFEREITKIADMLHEKDALLYMDGANLNALLGFVKPGSLGVDILHINLHKTFSTPHGGGGPGAGPVAVSEKLVDFLPVPRIVKLSPEALRRQPEAPKWGQAQNTGQADLSKNTGGQAPKTGQAAKNDSAELVEVGTGVSGFVEAYALDYDMSDSIGKIHGFLGNFGILVRALTYMTMLGKRGMRRVSENAILNANYLLSLVKDDYEHPFGSPVMHEFVISAIRQKEKGTKTLDIAKRLLDFGFHAPTTYFPLIVKEALMIEPTETETKETLEEFADALKKIAKEVDEDPEKLHTAPHTTPVSRLDEVKASKEIDVRFSFSED